MARNDFCGANINRCGARADAPLYFGTKSAFQVTDHQTVALPITNMTHGIVVMAACHHCILKQKELVRCLCDRSKCAFLVCNGYNKRRLKGTATKLMLARCQSLTGHGGTVMATAMEDKHQRRIVKLFRGGQV